ncbi:hypothetical protein [Actinoplanes sp. NPDC049118]|uniref:hypothetical protein n=1 Tax=Actinoplanes sp. NPDC049118 TaxID=3155769 RepID=UPI0033C2087D
MTAAAWIALAITVFGALCYATAAILQAVAARRTTSTVQALRHPLYLAGIGFDMLAWVGSIIALRELAVYVVESILAGSLAVTVVAARFILKSRLRGRDVAAVVASLAALAVLALSAGPQHDVTASTGLRLGFCAAAVTAALIGWGATRIGSPGLAAAVGGLCLGGAALTGRALPAGPMDIVTDPLTAALLTFAVTGMMMYAHALQIGQVGPVTAVHWTAEVIAPSAVALLFLGDAIRDGWQVPAAAAGLVTIAAAVLLATAPANSATHQPQTTPAPAAEPARPALPAAAPAVPRRSGERVIWWGPPPIWIPAARTPAALAAPPVRELGWSPHLAQPPWAQPRRPDADRDEVPVPALVMPRHPAPEPVAPPAPAGERPAPLSPWHDLSSPPDGPATGAGA